MAAACAAILLAAAPSKLRAETLDAALAATYATNPVLNAERAALRATDEEVPRALSGFRPRLFATGDIQHRRTTTAFPRFNSEPGFRATESLSTGGYAFHLEQILYAGGRNINATREAEALVRSAREVLRAVEQGVLLEAATAYVDVVREQAIVRLQERNVTVLAEQLQATRDRFEVGEVTRTDVAQAEAARAGAVSALHLAQANLQASRAAYERLVGHPPSGLTDPGPLNRLLPARMEDAIYVGDSENPSILAIVFLEQASAYTVKRITGELLPTATFEATHSERFNPTQNIDRQETTTFVGRVTVPLYQGGEVAARVRQAKDVNLQRRREIDQARVLVHADIVAAWGILTAARAQIASAQSQVEASRVALQGVREEEQVGQRTLLDVLDAEQRLLDAEVALITARRDVVVASYTLVAAVGRLDAPSLGLAVDYYDPLAHYERVRNKWWGLNAEPGYHGAHSAIVHEPTYDGVDMTTEPGLKRLHEQIQGLKP